ACRYGYPTQQSRRRTRESGQIARRSVLIFLVQACCESKGINSRRSRTANNFATCGDSPAVSSTTKRWRSTKNVCIHFQFLVIVYDVRSTLRNHFRRVCENCIHFAPRLRSHFRGSLYSLCVRKGRM